MNKQQLANKIWAAANKMRSKIDANEYKDYILGLIFYKFLSDKEEKYLTGQALTTEQLPLLIDDPNNEDAMELAIYCRESIGYFIAYDNLFSTWLKPESNFSIAQLNGALNAFNRWVSDNYKSVYEGIFNTLQAGLTKLGDNATSQTRAINDIIKLIKDFDCGLIRSS